ncbi:hypothetical protein FGO68_gene6884 [Halteria grandinella]|uniref:Uncharacterized protein n=1 Tax=Halteria grandinella TaxID=5974 RepID=A0A8J8SY34_HALGN|nr:hypothetical protein FGO68_gene6884 [Halteria grandinella]
MFRNYQEYKIDYNEALYQSIRQKAGNIANQLTNRKLLYREKEIAKQIKLKIQINKQKTQSIEGNKPSSQLDDILENYIFKYMDKFNDKLEGWGDQINHKLDSIIDHITANGQPMQDENGYYFPESCMDEITIVSKNTNGPIDFQQMNTKAQIDLSIIFQYVVQFEQEKEKKQINLLD